MKHGTVTAYTGHKCRCAKCREAWRVHQRKYQRRRRAALMATRERCAADGCTRRAVRAPGDDGTQPAFCSRTCCERHYGTARATVRGESGARHHEVLKAASKQKEGERQWQQASEVEVLEE